MRINEIYVNNTEQRFSYIVWMAFWNRKKIIFFLTADLASWHHAPSCLKCDSSDDELEQDKSIFNFITMSVVSSEQMVFIRWAVQGIKGFREYELVTFLDGRRHNLAKKKEVVEKNQKTGSWQNNDEMNFICLKKKAIKKCWPQLENYFKITQVKWKYWIMSL